MEKPQFDEMKLRGEIARFIARPFPPSGKPLEELSLDEITTRGIMEDLGKFLGRLHSIPREGYGWANGVLFNSTGILKGQHRSFYDFWLEFFNSLSDEMHLTLIQEKKTGVSQTPLSPHNRELLEQLLDARSRVLRIMQQNRSLFDSAPAKFLNGNIHLGSIYVDKGKFSGLADFNQFLFGDPVDDLAYFSVMPHGEKYLADVHWGWTRSFKEEPDDYYPRLHLYRLLEAYRKIFTRYTRHHYLEDYPEPLEIAGQELGYFSSV